jgi:hypothetical protein
MKYQSDLPPGELLDLREPVGSAVAPHPAQLSKDELAQFLAHTSSAGGAVMP